MTTRPYLFYDLAVSLCATCLRRVDAKVILEDGAVFFLKRCPEHGTERVLVADDAAYWRTARERWLKPGDLPRRFQTETRFGCPFDCGLCPDHEQHACVSLVELTDHCNLACPICYAESGPTRRGYRSLERVEAMLDAVCRAEGEPDVVQLSGGEPTLHPEFFRIVEAARRRPIRHLMVNTNGIRIARDEAFAEQLAEYRSGFEVYLQFDSFEERALVDLRGEDLRDVRRRAVERLNELELGTTLVVTVKRGVNDHELGRIVDWALEQPAVRGVTFQPIQDAGRTEGFDAARDRLTLTEVRRRLLEQTDVFQPEDVVPVPCHPDCIAMAYALRVGGEVHPLTRHVPPELLLGSGRGTITYERETELHARLFEAFSLGNAPDTSAEKLAALFCCLPSVELPAGLGYENVFRVVVMQFLDAHSFDVRAVKKACVQVVHPEDGRLIPLDTYNLFYRDDLETTRLAELRGAAVASGGRNG